MAEAPPTIAAVDYFDAASEFEVQGSNTEELKDFDFVISGTGNYACSAEFNEGDGYSSDYRYCNGTPDIDSDLATLISGFGDVFGTSPLVAQTGLRVEFNPGVGASVSLEGHQHDGAQSHVASTLRTADCSGIIPASSGTGVPSTLIVVAGTVTAVRATIEISANHIDKPGGDGVHFHGQNVGPCRVALTVDYEGQVSGVTAGNWLNIKVAKSNPNDDTPTCSLTAEQFVDLS